MKRSFISKVLALLICSFMNTYLIAEEAAFQIEEKVISVSDLYKKKPSKFYNIELEKYETVIKVAEQEYLNFFWEKQAKEKSISIEQAKFQYYESKIKVTNEEIDRYQRKYNDHPRLKVLPKDSQREQIIDYITSVQRQSITKEILENAKKLGEFAILYPKPKKPRFDLKVVDSDPVRYGPLASDIKPLGCSKNCKVEIVEYIDYQCERCKKLQKTVIKLLQKYRGKIRLVWRDLPISFHNRSRLAAIASRCAQNQGEFWKMSDQLLMSGGDLSDDEFEHRALGIGLNMKSFQSCLAKPVDAELRVDESLESAKELNIIGAPVLFINGKRLSNVQSPRELMEIVEEEMRI